jgi:hypothetical protein
LKSLEKFKTFLIKIFDFLFFKKSKKNKSVKMFKTYLFILKDEFKTHPFILESDEEELRQHLKNNYDVTKFEGRNIGNREISKSEYKELVLNRIQNHDLKNNYVEIANLNHKNIEPILNIQITNDFIYFTTPFFIDKLENVWKEKSQFVKYDVEEMFSDFWNALNFLKIHNISHGTIHENNLAFNGNNWYISGLFSTKKTGECMSGCYVKSSYKSRRFLKNSNIDNLRGIPSDDMWQLILMYVITYYGFNPFLNTYDKYINICIERGKCKEISKSFYGKYLKYILTKKYELENDDYDKILNIFKNNTDAHV